MLQKTSYIIFIILWGCQENSKKENNSYSEPIITKEKSVIESSFIVENYKTKFDWSKVEIEINETEKTRLINILKPHFDYFLESEYYRDVFN
jgi:hypothetical protein